MRQSAAMVAAGLDVPLDEFAMSAKNMAPAPESMFLAASGITIERGTAAGVRRRFVARAGGRPFYEMTVELTVALGLGPGWRATPDEPNWRIEIDGTPNLTAEISVSVPAGPAIAELNAARAINSVPRVVEAPAGGRSVLDFPAATGNAATD